MHFWIWLFYLSKAVAGHSAKILHHCHKSVSRVLDFGLKEANLLLHKGAHTHIYKMKMQFSLKSIVFSFFYHLFKVEIWVKCIWRHLVNIKQVSLFENSFSLGLDWFSFWCVLTQSNNMVMVRLIQCGRYTWSDMVLAQNNQEIYGLLFQYLEVLFVEHLSLVPDLWSCPQKHEVFN